MEKAKETLVKFLDPAVRTLGQIALEGTRPMKIGDKWYAVPVRSDDTQRHAAENIITTVIGKTKDEGKAAPGKIEMYDPIIQINIGTEMMRKHHLEMLDELKKKDEDVIDAEVGDGGE